MSKLEMHTPFDPITPFHGLYPIVNLYRCKSQSTVHHCYQYYNSKRQEASVTDHKQVTFLKMVVHLKKEGNVCVCICVHLQDSCIVKQKQ